MKDNMFFWRELNTDKFAKILNYDLDHKTGMVRYGIVLRFADKAYKPEHIVILHRCISYLQTRWNNKRTEDVFGRLMAPIIRARRPDLALEIFNSPWLRFNYTKGPFIKLLDLCISMMEEYIYNSTKIAPLNPYPNESTDSTWESPEEEAKKAAAAAASAAASRHAKKTVEAEEEVKIHTPPDILYPPLSKKVVVKKKPATDEAESQTDTEVQNDIEIISPNDQSRLIDTIIRKTLNWIFDSKHGIIFDANVYYKAAYAYGCLGDIEQVFRMLEKAEMNTKLSSDEENSTKNTLPFKFSFFQKNAPITSNIRDFAAASIPMALFRRGYTKEAIEYFRDFKHKSSHHRLGALYIATHLLHGEYEQATQYLNNKSSFTFLASLGNLTYANFINTALVKSGRKMELSFDPSNYKTETGEEPEFEIVESTELPTYLVKYIPTKYPYIKKNRSLTKLERELLGEDRLISDNTWVPPVNRPDFVQPQGFILPKNESSGLHNHDESSNEVNEVSEVSEVSEVLQEDTKANTNTAEPL